MPPMHQVKRRRTACFCTFDGCRCSHTLPDTIRIRLRGVSSYPCLNIDGQACESVIWRFVSFQSNLAIRYHQNSQGSPAVGAHRNLSKYAVEDSSSYDLIASLPEISCKPT